MCSSDLLFTLVVNTLLFYITDMIGDLFNVGLQDFGFWSAFLGALIVSIISLILTSIIKDDDKPVVRKTPS